MTIENTSEEISRKLKETLGQSLESTEQLVEGISITILQASATIVFVTLQQAPKLIRGRLFTLIMDTIRKKLEEIP